MTSRNDPLAIWLEEVARRDEIGTDLREVSRRVVYEVARTAGIKAPAVVVFFSPPFYSQIRPRDSPVSNAVRKVLNQLRTGKLETNGKSTLWEMFAAAVPEPADPPIELCDFYPYISDLSFLGLDEDLAGSVDELKENMPLFRRGYWLDFKSFADLGCGVINIGPYGRDAHGLFERVNTPYSFEVVPQLIYETVQEVLR